MDSANLYKIVSQDRLGQITYCDVINKTTYTASPVRIITDHQLIVKFSSLQSFYIGLLAGLSNVKKRKRKISPEKSHLKLVE